jgi:hypothetical protein
MKSCSKCFAVNEPTAEFCVDCGAAFASGGEGSDTEVYNELARANVLRIRGDWKGAADVCLGILKRFPNNATAHTLLGDIHAEGGDLKQAASWYEMALDLNPDSKADKEKLASVQTRMKEHEAAQTAEQLGIPERRSMVLPYVLVLGVIVLGVAVASYVIGQNSRGRPVAPITDPIELSAAQKRDEPAKPEEKPEPTASVIGQDQALLTALQAGGSGLAFVDAVEDPRGPGAIVTVQAEAGQDTEATAKRAAAEFFRVQAGHSRLMVRVVSEGAVVYACDAVRGSDPNSEPTLSFTWRQGQPASPPPPPDETGGEGTAGETSTAGAGETGGTEL